MMEIEVGGGGFCCERAAAHVYSMLLELKSDQYAIIL